MKSFESIFRVPVKAQANQANHRASCCTLLGCSAFATQPSILVHLLTYCSAPLCLTQSPPSHHIRFLIVHGQNSAAGPVTDNLKVPPMFRSKMPIGAVMSLQRIAPVASRQMWTRPLSTAAPIKRVSNGSGAPWLFGFGCGAAAGLLVATNTEPMGKRSAAHNSEVRVPTEPVAAIGRTRVHSDLAPTPGPYSQAIRDGRGTVYLSGQVGRIPGTKTLVKGGIGAETTQALTNLANVLDAANSEVGLICKTTVLLHDMSDYAAMNEAYSAFFAEHMNTNKDGQGKTPAALPARAAFAVRDLPLNAKVEIEAVATEKQ
jgi:2-iminobutanoate/2-iminopropanoate deaminase